MVDEGQASELLHGDQRSVLPVRQRPARAEMLVMSSVHVE